jgi:hemerythrin superfamily protein
VNGRRGAAPTPLSLANDCKCFATGTKPPDGWLAPHIIKGIIMADQAQDAVALLKADHRKVEELFASFEKASGDGKKQKIAEEICMELTVHAQIEEEIFYPACEGKVEEDLLKEAYVEHDGAKILIAEIEAGGPSDEFYDAKVSVLSEQIEHHVKEEEQRIDGMFAQAKKAGLDMDALGEELATRKAALIASYQKGGTPKPELTTMSATPA